MMEDLIGKTLGPYQITDRIGATATGTLYKAYQPWLRQYVTIKVLPPRMVRDPSFGQRIRAAARLSHGNIASIYDLRQDHGITYLVTEYVEGTGLDRIVWPDEGLSPRAVLPVLDQIARALDYAHGQGIVHGGLTPGNILLTRDRRPVVTDFGLAPAKKAVSSADLESLKYMAPEQTRGDTADPRTDVYALGAVLYYMLTGRAPVEGPNAQAIHNNLTQRSPVPPSRLNPAVSSAVDTVVMKALQKNPGQRYQRAGEMAAAFRAAVDRRPAGRIEPPKVLRWVAIAASLAVLLMVVGITALWVRGGGGASPTDTPGLAAQVTSEGPVVGETSGSTMTITWTPTPVVVPAGTATSTPVPAATQIPTATGTPTTLTPTSTSTPRPTATAQPTATPTPAPVPVSTNTPPPPPTNTPPLLPTNTSPPLPTNTPSLPTNTPPPLPTNTPPPLPTETPPLPTNTPPPLPTSIPLPPTDTPAPPTNTPPALEPTATSPPLPLHM